MGSRVKGDISLLNINNHTEDKTMKKRQSIIVFGASGRLKKYLSIIEVMYHVMFICDNDANKWGQKFESYSIKNPEIMLEYPETMVIIVSSYEKEIYLQLSKMGVKNVHTLFGLPEKNEPFSHRLFLYNMIKRQGEKVLSQGKLEEIYYNWNNHWSTREIVRESRDYGFSGKGKILDYGFGCGTLVLNGLVQGQEMYGIDLDQEKKQYYDMKVEDLNYPEEWKNRCILYDGNTIPFADETFDYIFCDYVLEHVPDLDRSISEMVRVCKKGGKIHLACPNYDSSFEEHYLVDFGKKLHGNREEFKNFLIEKNKSLDMLDGIYFVNLDDVITSLSKQGEFMITDLHKESPLKGINLIIEK